MLLITQNIYGFATKLSLEYLYF